MRCASASGTCSAAIAHIHTVYFGKVTWAWRRTNAKMTQGTGSKEGQLSFCRLFRLPLPMGMEVSCKYTQMTNT